MSVYAKGDNTINSGQFTQSEIHLYGSSRLGIYNANTNLQQYVPNDSVYMSGLSQWARIIVFARGQKNYELTNQWGSAIVIITDKKVGFRPINSSSSIFSYYNPEVVTAQDYYLCGMQMPGRIYQPTGRYRYEYQGQETDKEFYDGAVSFEYRIEDPRIARFLSVDPLDQEFPWNSPYSVQENKFGWGRELEGL